MKCNLSKNNRWVFAAGFILIILENSCIAGSDQVSEKQDNSVKPYTGDILEAFFVADKEGTFQASACFVAAPDYGVVQISLNGQTILKKFNAYNDTLSAKVVGLGKLDIQKGKNEIQITIVGQSPETGDAMFGLDYIQFERSDTR